jgi:hypothetical protein
MTVFLTMLLVFAIVFSLVGCGSKASGGTTYTAAELKDLLQEDESGMAKKLRGKDVTITGEYTNYYPPENGPWGVSISDTADNATTFEVYGDIPDAFDIGSVPGLSDATRGDELTITGRVAGIPSGNVHLENCRILAIKQKELTTNPLNAEEPEETEVPSAPDAGATYVPSPDDPYPGLIIEVRDNGAYGNGTRLLPDLVVDLEKLRGYMRDSQIWMLESGYDWHPEQLELRLNSPSGAIFSGDTLNDGTAALYSAPESSKAFFSEYGLVVMYSRHGLIIRFKVDSPDVERDPRYEDMIPYSLSLGRILTWDEYNTAAVEGELDREEAYSLWKEDWVDYM